ncbi:MAG: heavy metal-associated domain-containing protein [Chromatiaceae bacterium]
MRDTVKPKSRDVWEVRRRIRLPALQDPHDDVAAERALAGIDGVLGVSVDHAKRWVAVDYLVTKTDYQSLERALEAAGLTPATGGWARFRSAWYQNLDLTGRENAAEPTPACCNKPPVAGHRSRIL